MTSSTRPWKVCINSGQQKISKFCLFSYLVSVMSHSPQIEARTATNDGVTCCAVPFSTRWGPMGIATRLLAAAVTDPDGIESSPLEQFFHRHCAAAQSSASAARARGRLPASDARRG
jgi:hypothetical protein